MKCDKLKAMTILNAYQVECDDYDLVYRKDEVDQVIARLEADYKDACGHLQTVSLIAKEQKEKADKLISFLNDLVMRDLIKDCPTKEVAAKIVKEFQ